MDDPFGGGLAAARHRLIVPALLALVGLPVAAGVAVSLLLAWGITPGLGGGGPSLEAWRDLADTPGAAASLLLTVRTGLLATVLSTLSALVLGLGGRPWMARVTAPILAVPHAALAIGLGFLIAPTGLLVRLCGLPPLPFATVGDPFGVAVILALWLKETPFLLLCLLAAMGEADVARSRMVAAGLGHAPWRVALLVVLPRVWPRVRLPVMAVLAFSLSVTDVALLLGPQTPPTLAVSILRWSRDPDLSRWPVAAAASLLLVALTLAAFLALAAIEAVLARLARALAMSGRRGAGAPDGIAAVVSAAIALLGCGALASLLLWAGASVWRFPEALPAGWSWARIATRLPDLAGPAVTTVWLGGAATAAALVLAVATLRAGIGVRLVWAPLLLPQAGFLFGVQIPLARARLDGSALALIWSHLLFVFPYVLLALRGPWHALDARHARAAASLGASPWRVLTRVTLPLLATPLRAAAAIGFSVSVALYLPTLFAGAGRVDTLATLAVSLASGADRRPLAAAALAQAALPALAFALAARR